MLTFRDIKDTKLLERFMSKLGIPPEDYINLPLEDVLDIIEQDFDNKELEDAFAEINEDMELVIMRRVINDRTLGDSYANSTKEELHFVYEELTTEDERNKILEWSRNSIDCICKNLYNTKEDSKYTRFLVNSLALENITFEDIVNADYDLVSLIKPELLSKLNYKYFHMKTDLTKYPLASLSKRDESTIVKEVGCLAPNLNKEELLNKYATYVDDITKKELLETNDWLLDFEPYKASEEDTVLQYMVEEGLITEKEAINGYEKEIEVSVEDFDYVITPYDWGKSTNRVIDFLTDKLIKISDNFSLREKDKRYVLEMFYRLSKKTRLDLVKEYKYL